MATKISEYSSTPASNTDLDGINLSENVMVPSDVNDALRMQMAHLKDLDTGASALTSPEFASATMTGDLNFGTSDKAIFGSGDLEIYSDASHSYIIDNGTGNLRLKAQNFQVLGNADDEAQIEAYQNDGVYLYFNGNQKLATTNTGVDVTGVITTDGMTTSADINFGDNDKALFGAGNDLQIYHNGSNSYISDQGAGSLWVQATNLIVEATDGSNYLTAVDGGAVKLYYADSASNEKLATTATGVDVTGTVTMDGATTTGNINFGDSDKALFGAGNDLQIYHDSLNSYIVDNGTGDLIVQGGNNVFIKDGSGNNMLRTTDGAQVRLYYGNATRLDTTASGISVTGSVVSDGLTVDGGSTSTISVFSQGRVSATTLSEGASGAELMVGSSNPLALGTAGTERMRIDSSGRVGIGTSSPDFKAEIVGGTNNGLHIKDAESATVFGGLFTQSANLALVARSNHALTLGTNDTERLRIDSSGNLLHQRTSNTISGTSVNKMTLGNGTGQYGAIIDVGSGSGYYGFAKNGAYNSRIRYDYTSDFMAFDVNNSEAMRIDSSGNVGIGGSPSHKLDVVGNARLNPTSNPVLRFSENGTLRGLLTSSSSLGLSVETSGTLPFRVVTNGSEAMRISGSDVLIGTTNIGIGNLGWSFRKNNASFVTTDANPSLVVKRGSNTGTAIEFVGPNSNSVLGNISVSTTAVSFNTTSDYRLKENVTAITSATDRLNQLNPVRFNFIADADTTVDGFLAHEIVDIVPEAISGTKDAMRDEEYEVTPAVLDDDDNEVTPAVMGTRSVPDYQGIDQSKLVPLLTAALQEALTKIDQLETRITALEA